MTIPLNKTGYVLILSCLASQCGSAVAQQQLKRSDALQKLDDGNKRFVEGKSTNAHEDAARRKETAADPKTPIAIVLACSDSRVPVEVLFDQGIGDLYVVRVAGGVLGAYELASLELAVSQMPNTPIILVLGHTHCDAVITALEQTEKTDSIKKITNVLKPSIEIATKINPHLSGRQLCSAVSSYSLRQTQADIVRSSPLIQDRIRNRLLSVFGAMYDTETGKIQWMGQHADYGIPGIGQDTKYVPLPDDADLEPFTPKKEDK